MKREELAALGVSEAVLDKIMTLNGADIEMQKQTSTTLATERDALKTQLAAANEAIGSYKAMNIDGVKKAAEEWKQKYNTETAALKAQLAEKEYGYHIQQAVGSLKFTSEGAKKAFVADLTAKKLPTQEGKFLGLEDFVKGYQTSDPGAFAQETAPRVVSATPGAAAATDGRKEQANAAFRAAFGKE